MEYPEDFTIQIYDDPVDGYDRIWVGCFDKSQKLFFGFMFYFNQNIYVNIDPTEWYWYYGVATPATFINKTENYIEQFEYNKWHNVAKIVINEAKLGKIHFDLDNHWSAPFKIKSLEV